MSQIKGYEPGMVKIGADHIWEDACTGETGDGCPPRIELPHSCGCWIIGTREEARQLVNDLLALIIRMEP